MQDDESSAPNVSVASVSFVNVSGTQPPLMDVSSPRAATPVLPESPQPSLRREVASVGVVRPYALLRVHRDPTHTYLQRLQQHLGFSSVDQLINHLLEKAGYLRTTSSSTFPDTSSSSSDTTSSSAHLDDKQKRIRAVVLEILSTQVSERKIPLIIALCKLLYGDCDVSDIPCCTTIQRIRFGMAHVDHQANTKRFQPVPHVHVGLDESTRDGTPYVATHCTYWNNQTRRVEQCLLGAPPATGHTAAEEAGVVAAILKDLRIRCEQLTSFIGDNANVASSPCFARSSTLSLSSVWGA